MSATYRMFIITIALLTFFYASAAGDIYKWVDEQGGIHFTDRYESIPEKYRDEAETKFKEKGFEERARPTDSQETGKSPSPADGAFTLKQSATIRVDKEGHDEEWWQQRIKENRARLKQLLQEKAKLEEELQRVSRRYSNPAFGRQGRRSLESGVEDLQEKIKSLAEESQKVKETLEQELPEKAAKAGAPAEWLR